METEEIYVDEISEAENESGNLFSDSDTDSVLMQYRRR